MSLPAKQSGNRDKGQLLREQTGPFLETARDDDAVVRRQHGIAGHHMGLRRQMGTDLTGEGKGAEATGDGDRLVTVSVDYLRGKKPGGAPRSARHR